MSLSVERLEQIRDYHRAEAVATESPDDWEYAEWHEDIAKMADELIAIKEAEPVAYGMPNSAITGAPHALMLVSLDVPSSDQYGGALWVPLIRKPE